ncbi:TIGR03089 family protein [Rhizomonospora bruguierae]|uniref:TIGR03089 family protein n=1 Tax=Rhizomonospora bruguierae TaxID=1581705 RepID=UPI001BCA8AA4|nr:TIGR03089 family protein [Micromonospora sp. NBRC 107566]
MALPATTGARPLLTYYDDATGERAELASADLARWSARAAALLHDGYGLGPGSRAAVLLPPHWQTAAALMGAWAVGVAVSFRPTATAGLPALGPGQDEPFDATLVAHDRIGTWLEDVPRAHHRFVFGLAPGGAVLGEVPDGYLDFMAEVDRYPGPPAGAGPVSHDAPASVDGTTYAEWGRLADALAEQLDLRAGDRLLIDAAEHEHPVRWLLAPMAAGASVVLCANLDRSRLPGRVEAEAVTRVL